MSIFSKLFKSQSQEPDFVYDQAVLIAIDFSGVDDFGTADQQKEIQDLEAAIEEVLPEQSGLDGDEFGNGECVIYVYGPSADEMFGVIEPLLRKTSFTHIDVTLQYGPPEDPSTKDKKFTL